VEDEEDDVTVDDDDDDDDDDDELGAATERSGVALRGGNKESEKVGRESTVVFVAVLSDGAARPVAGILGAVGGAATSEGKASGTLCWSSRSSTWSSSAPDSMAALAQCSQSERL